MIETPYCAVVAPGIEAQVGLGPLILGFLVVGMVRVVGERACHEVGGIQTSNDRDAMLCCGCIRH